MVWEEVGHVAEVGSAKRIFAKEYCDFGIPFLRSKEIGDLSRREDIATELFISKERFQEIKVKYGVPKIGDLLLTSVGTIGNTWIVDNRDFYFKDGNITCISPSEKLDIIYLKYFFQSNSFWSNLDRNTSGSAYKALTITKIKKLKIPLPPLPIQKKIAAILDAADNYRQKTKALIDKYDQLTQSIFLDMFGDTWLNPKGWEVRSLNELSVKITDGTHKTPKYKEKGVVFLSAKNVKKCELNQNECKFISQEEHVELSKRCHVEKDDIVITKSGSLGMAAMVKLDIEFSIFESLALVKYIREEINGTFLLYQLNTSSNKFQYGRITKGVGVKHLHLTDLRKLKIICPPLKLQMLFEERIKLVEIQRFVTKNKIKKAEQLFQSLLQKAFKGELVN